MPPLAISPSRHPAIPPSLSFPFSEINQATCTWEMRWHFPIMRAMGGRKGITGFPEPHHRQRLTFSITESKCTCVELQCVCVCTRVRVCGLRFILAADGKEVIHLVKAVSQSLCVCAAVCVYGVCSSVCKHVCVCVCGESSIKVKRKHDLWKGVGLESSTYSEACKSW